MSDEDSSGQSAATEVAEAEFGVPRSWSRGQKVLHPTRGEYLEVARALYDAGYLMCVDVTAVDYFAAKQQRTLPDGVVAERFEVVAGFISHADRSRVRLRVQVPESDPTCPSLWELHAGVEALEREVFDLFGISFEGHPDMTRILMPENWQGHPLRKDYAMGRIPVQFKGAPSS